MSRKWTLLTLILLLGSGATLQAEPLDSPGVVYIDGQPCNRACQSYMDWSYRALSARRHEEREISVAVPAEAEIERVEPVARPRLAKHVAQAARTAPRVGRAASNGKAPNSKKIAVAKPAPAVPAKDMQAATAAVTPEKAAGETVAAVQKREPKLESSGRPEPAQAATVAASQAAEAKAPTSEVKPVAKLEVVLPPPAALDIAAAPAAPGKASDKAREIGKIAAASPDDQDDLVALVLTRPEVHSLSDLNNKTIAITEKQSASSGRISVALMAAGAAEVQFSEVKASAIDRLISGEVPAAVVLASREVANLFPEVEGFRTFRVPLSMKARL